jgi:hypothetical protein
MTDGSTTQTSRRAILAGAIGGLVGWAATAIGGPEVARAGVDGDVVLGTINTTAGNTIVKSTTVGGKGFQAWSSALTGLGVGLYGQVDSTGEGASGVFGLATALSGVTAGVQGGSSSSSGVGVLGVGSTGVRGDGRTTGDTGGFFTGDGYALQADGKVHFSRSGRSLVTKGHSTFTKTLGGVSSTSHVFAVLGSNRSGFWVRAVVPSAGSFKVYLNAKVTSSTYVQWFVLD